MAELKNVLVTGGSGFVGKNIVEQLGNTFHILAPGHTELNILDTAQVDKFFVSNGIDAVVHTADVGVNSQGVQVADVAQNNLRMFFNITRVLKPNQKMIFLGSGAEYDKSRSLVNVKENEFGQNVPVDDYGFAKYVCSQYIQNSGNIVNLRCFGVYGKYENYQTRFISNSICKALFDLPVTMKQNVFFDYVYINDLVGVISYFIEHKPNNKFYNVGRGESIDLQTIAQKVLKILKKDLPILAAKDGLNKEYTCDVSLLKSEIPNLKFTDFDQSIKELAEYYKSILADLKKEDFLIDP